MTVDVYDPNDGSPDDTISDRYAAIETPSGELVVFDALEADAWIQSTSATSLADVE